MVRVHGLEGLIRIVAVAGLAAAATACASYPTEPRYSTRPTEPLPVMEAPPAYEPPPPVALPSERIDGGTLPPAAGAPPATPAPAPPAPITPPSASTPVVTPRPTPAPIPAGAVAYVIQPGDTLSGVGRRFRTPVQTLIDLNSLGPQGAIAAGQRIRLPNGVVDGGSDPYATGPAPAGAGDPATTVPPPPAPPRPAPAAPAPRPANPAPTPAPRPASPAPAPTRPAASGAVSFVWPVRGDIVRRFGPSGVSQRNNGINIGADRGAEVVAAAAGRVAYVGDQLPGQGLTVLIVHADGWRTVYGHLGSAAVDDGDQVRSGQRIGTVGETGGDGRPSVHFETRRMQGDNPVAVDPVSVLPR